MIDENASEYSFSRKWGVMNRRIMPLCLLTVAGFAIGCSSPSAPEDESAAETSSSSGTHVEDSFRVEPVYSSGQRPEQSTIILNEHIAKTSESTQLTPNSIPGCAGCGPEIHAYGWSQGNGPVTMIPVSQGICGLTAVGGLFRGTGEFIRIDNVAGNWQLSGASQQQGVYAQVRCVDFSKFTTSGGIKYTDSSYWAWMNSGNVPGADYQIPMWGYDSTCWLNGFGGYFGGGSTNSFEQYVSADTTPANANPSNVIALDLKSETANQYLEGRAACMAFNGKPFVNETQLGGSSVNFGIANDGICFLDTVGGVFNSAISDGAWITVEGNQGVQVMHVSGNSAGGSVFARNVCIKYNQL